MLHFDSVYGFIAFMLIKTQILFNYSKTITNIYIQKLINRSICFRPYKIISKHYFISIFDFNIEYCIFGIDISTLLESIASARAIVILIEYLFLQRFAPKFIVHKNKKIIS